MVIKVSEDDPVYASLGGSNDPLSVLNERASQIGVDLTWNYASSGEPHDKIWRSECHGALLLLPCLRMSIVAQIRLLHY